MKKIINGKTYDTETAKEVRSRYWKKPTSTWRTIYKTKTGEYFLIEESIKGIKWAILTEKEVKAKAEEYITDDKYETEFGEEEEQ